MTFGNAGWPLDLDRLAAAVTPRTRALFVDLALQPDRLDRDARRSARDARARAPARPLDHRRRDLYALLYGEGARAPSFHDIMEPEDRILFVNTFSKNWAMTGWRIGWIEAPRARPGDREPDPVFDLGRRAVPAARRRRGARRGEGFVAHRSRARGAAGRSSATRSAATGRVPLRAAARRLLPVLRVDGETDTRRLACGWSTRRMSGSRPEPPSAPAARVSCGCALRAIPSSLKPREVGCGRGGIRQRIIGCVYCK